MKEKICIINPKLAKHLIKLGHIVVDIKPNRELLNGTVFIFANNEELQNEIRNFNK